MTYFSTGAGAGAAYSSTNADVVQDLEDAGARYSTTGVPEADVPVDVEVAGRTAAVEVLHQSVREHLEPKMATENGVKGVKGVERCERCEGVKGVKGVRCEKV